MTYPMIYIVSLLPILYRVLYHYVEMISKWWSVQNSFDHQIFEQAEPWHKIPFYFPCHYTNGLLYILIHSDGEGSYYPGSYQGYNGLVNPGPGGSIHSIHYHV